MKLLLVEDDVDIQAVIELSLALDPGIAVTSYASGEVALQAITEEQSTFDIALLDFNLPLMTGIELHDRLRELPQMDGFLTVLITGQVSPEDLRSYRAAGVSGIIPKPFDALTLAREVRALAQQRVSRRAPFAWLGRRVWQSA